MFEGGCIGLSRHIWNGVLDIKSFERYTKKFLNHIHFHPSQTQDITLEVITPDISPLAANP